MSGWDRIQRLEMEIMGLRVELAHVTEQRDLARRVAMRLEEENHALAAGIVTVPVWGEAR